ncbi:hypothetical protein ABG79_01035 [Caloramator mitchellensis]|uniref:DUF4364 domain-containing protein n=1 Tax=Caloramator mitchellensis TaxID=908809 RepID=A0A0R3JUK3_CALMK|nr:DUF4364 family protein [Caloramator mitchellensis]KRQ87232.1 hypothetical protein ABG79_01035 [Caloramator mitchellensis]
MYRDTTELAENKLLILYILNKIDASITNSYLTQIVLENNLINYFSLQQYISELIESGFIDLTKEINRQLLKITLKGKRTLDFFIDRIPENKTKIIDAYLLEKEIEVQYEYIPRAKFENIGNDYFVDIKLLENDKIIFDLRLRTNSLENANTICENWEKKYSHYYDTILKTLTKEI